MKKIIFSGVGTALITPMKDGKIDYLGLEGLIEWQISEGVGALIIGGTTGEAATLSDRERYELYSFAKKCAGDRIPLIFGTGTNDTEAAIKHTKMAERIGCDGALAVTPYYNRGTSEGIVRHYKKIAESTELPIILYNVPKRTGVNLSQREIERIAECENIVAIKEAGDSLDRLCTLAALSERIGLYAGCDSHTYSVLSLGGLGVISVASNLFPSIFVKLYSHFVTKDRENALRLQLMLLPFISAIFMETNPSPIKYAMSLAGLCSPEVRLPLYECENATRDRVKLEYERLLQLSSEL